MQAEERLEEAKAANLALQEAQARKHGSLVLRLIRGGLSILAAALAAQQACPHPCCWLLCVMHAVLLSQPTHIEGCAVVRLPTRGWQVSVAE